VITAVDWQAGGGDVSDVLAEAGARLAA